MPAMRDAKGRFVSSGSSTGLFGVGVKFKATPKQVEKAVDKGAYNSFFHAAGSIRKAARKSIRGRRKPGPPGGAVRTRLGKGGGRARRAILFKASKEGAVIGFAASKIDQAMQVHEHGGVRGGVRFPARPTMLPALERNLARFHREWAGAIS